MSLISESLKRAHDDRSHIDSRPVFNLVDSQSSTSKSFPIARIILWLTIPVFFLAGWIAFGLNKNDAKQLVQIAPVQIPTAAVTSLEYDPSPDSQEEHHDPEQIPTEPVIPKIKKTRTTLSVPKMEKMNTIDEEPSVMELQKLVVENNVTMEEPASNTPTMQNTARDGGLPEASAWAVTKATDEVMEEDPLKNEMSKVHVTLTAKKPPVEKTVVASRISVAKPEHQMMIASSGEAEKSPGSLVQDAAFYFKMGVFYQRTGDPIEALDYYNKALQLDPVNAEIYNNRSLIYKELGKYDKAVTGFLKAIHFDPKYVKAYNNIGLLYFLKNNHTAAIASFQKALEIDPRNLESYNNLASVYKKQDNPVRARELYQTILKKNPGQIEAHYNLALLYEQEGDYPNAIAHYSRFVKLGATLRPKLAKKVRAHLKLLQ